MEDKCLWRLVEKRQETSQTETLVLEPQEGLVEYLAGQYLTVLLAEHGPTEGKAYSLSSAPYEKEVTLTIKRMGDFSNALLDLPVGTVIESSVPYGFFYPEAEDEGALVFVVGGVGIAPVFSIIKQLLYDKDQRPLHLFYSNQTRDSIIFLEELSRLEADSKGQLKISHFITRERTTDSRFQNRRVTGADIVQNLPSPTSASFFVCGSTAFTRGIWDSLRHVEIKPEQIYTEGFF